METIKIAEINRYNKTSKSTGKPFVSVAIKTEDGRSISGFGNKDNEGWQSGDEVAVDVIQKGEYLNFTVPKGTFSKGNTAPDANRLEMKIDRALALLSTVGGEITSIKGVLGDILSKVDPAVSDGPGF